MNTTFALTTPTRQMSSVRVSMPILFPALVVALELGDCNRGVLVPSPYRIHNSHYSFQRLLKARLGN